jgi:predicted AlkP superfamily phosphohydrolase/phosphomutase
MTIRIENPQHRIQLALGDTSHPIEIGSWSPWIPITFPTRLLGGIPGQVRFRLISIEPFRLYMTPLQIDPSRPPAQAKLSSPRSYAAQLAHRSGPFPTLGWASATNPLKDELIDETVFLESAWSTLESRRRIVLEELKRFEKGLHASFLYVPDRICHMMWRLTDRQSPRYDEDLAQRHGDAIREAYRRIDRLVGEIVKQFVDERTLFLLFSDHGFAPFRYGVHLNTWLEQAGYLVLRTPSGAQYARPASGDLSQVDWTRTRAYSLGLGKIFLNLQGREPRGIVPSQDAEKLASQIARELTAYRHKRFGRIVTRVDRRETLFQGPYVHEAADLFVSFRRGFRVSWETSLGGFGPQVVVPNPLKWSGDHASVDPALVPGIFLSNRPLLHPSSIRLLDIGPTILRAIGVEPSEAVDGTIHLFQTNEESHERHP